MVLFRYPSLTSHLDSGTEECDTELERNGLSVHTRYGSAGQVASCCLRQMAEKALSTDRQLNGLSELNRVCDLLPCRNNYHIVCCSNFLTP